MWPTIEVGVGLIVCNLPSLSFRAAHFLPKLIRYGWNSSLSGIRQAAEKLTSRSDSGESSSSDAELRKISDESAAASDEYGTRFKESNRLERRASETTISHAPLVHVRSDIVVKSEAVPLSERGMRQIPEPAEWEKWKPPRGFDVV